MNVGEFCRALYQLRARTGTAASLSVALGGEFFVYRMIREVGDPPKLVFIDLHLAIAEIETTAPHLIGKYVDKYVEIFSEGVEALLQQQPKEEGKPHAYN